MYVCSNIQGFQKFINFCADNFLIDLMIIIKDDSCLKSICNLGLLNFKIYEIPFCLMIFLITVIASTSPIFMDEISIFIIVHRINCSQL